MSYLKPNAGSLESPLKPGFVDNYNRFCENCSTVIENMALDKFSGIKCPHCKYEVEYLDKSDGLYRRCVRCCAMLRCKTIYITKNVIIPNMTTNLFINIFVLIKVPQSIATCVGGKTNFTIRRNPLASKE